VISVLRLLAEVTMGGDCCGASEAVEAVSNLVLEDPNAAKAKPKDAKQPRPAATIIAEKAPYYKKRIELFNQYKARETGVLEAAKAANVPITVTLPDNSQKQVRSC
jgi:hypothetical protein